MMPVTCLVLAEVSPEHNTYVYDSIFSSLLRGPQFLCLPWMNVVADRVGRDVLWGGGASCPLHLMTREVYHAEQRHGHLTPGLIVTASKSLESSIGNR